MKKGQFLLDAYKEKVYDLYLIQLKSASEIGRILGVGRQTVINYLKKEKIYVIRDNRLYSKYKVDEEYFSVIDTEEKAYWLGFIGADGSVENTKLRMTIMLNEKDFHHLEKFNNSVNSTATIKYYDNKVYTSVCSKKFCENLIKLNIIPNKTLVYSNAWEKIPKNLWHHYIRGYFDGDGSIWKQNRDGFWGINFTGSHNLMNELKEILPVYMSITDKGNYSTISTMKKSSIVELIDYLYKDATIYLDRKYEKSQLALNDYQGSSD